VADKVAEVAGVEVSTDHWIDGRRVASSQGFSDLSPVDGSNLAEVSAGGQAEVDMVVAAAARPFRPGPRWVRKAACQS
jgi:5-carboxymethyl-2-hydroxymuconic-semialdehyde dehydrogenase